MTKVKVKIKDKKILTCDELERGVVYEVVYCENKKFIGSLVCSLRGLFDDAVFMLKNNTENNDLEYTRVDADTKFKEVKASVKITIR